MKTTKLKFNPNAKSYVPENINKVQQNYTPNIQQNQQYFSFKSVYPENMEEISQYHDKLLGTALPDNSEETIVVRKTCLELAGAQKEKFPGSLAASLNKQNAALTRTKGYMISHNPDGSRYLLLTINDNIYLIDRSMRVFYVTKLFSPSFISIVGNNTLIDGYILKRKEIENPKNVEKSEEKKVEEEKTENNSEDTNKIEENKPEEINYNGVHFLIVDGICIRDHTVRAFHIDQRIKSVEQLFSPLLTSFKIVPKEETENKQKEEKKEESNNNTNNNNTNNNNKEKDLPPSFVVIKPDEKHSGKISLAVQQYYPASQLDQMFKKCFPTFGFPRVGILLSPATEIYKLGYNEFLLLWKPMEQITVDFKVGIVKKHYKGNAKIWYQLLKSNHGELILHDWITEKGGSKLSKINDGQVIRCFWDPNGTTIVPPSSNDEKPKEYKGGWVMKTILNKSQPNEDWVVSKLVENIESHIGKQDLIKVVTTDKELGEEFKLQPSRFAPKKRTFWKQPNGNNGTDNNGMGYNNNSNGGFVRKNGEENGNFNHQSSGSSSSLVEPTNGTTSHTPNNN